MANILTLRDVPSLLKPSTVYTLSGVLLSLALLTAGSYTSINSWLGAFDLYRAWKFLARRYDFMRSNARQRALTKFRVVQVRCMPRSTCILAHRPMV